MSKEQEGEDLAGAIGSFIDQLKKERDEARRTAEALRAGHRISVKHWITNKRPFPWEKGGRDNP